MTTRKTKLITRIALAVFVVMMTCASAWAQMSINSAADWNTFVTNVSSGTNYNGQTVTLNADITVSSMVGQPGYSNCQFQGTFDGGGHTLTLDYTTTEGVCAPFRYVDNATIQNLHVDGDINTSDMYAAGIVGAQSGTLTLSNCRSSVNIRCSRAGNCSIGGLVGLVYLNSPTMIEGCVFDGSLVSVNTGENLSTNCGGFIGYTYSTYTISNSFLVPSSITIGFGAGEEPSFVFARPNYATTVEGRTITNCYWYSEQIANLHYNDQGTKAYSITAGERVSVANASTVSNNYAYSGLTLYNTGIKFNNVLYAASADEVSLTLGNTPATNYTFDQYTASAGTLTGTANPYSLTMPAEDVTINGVFIAPISYMNADGSLGYKAANEYTVLTGGGATSLSAGWYVVNSNINYTGKVTINGDVTIILCDGCTMNIGTEGSPISEQGLGGQNLTIYGQTLNETAAGQLNVYAARNYANSVGLSYYVQNSGNVNVINSGTNDAYGIEADFTINGGKLYVRGVSRAIGSSNIYINGGKVTTIASIYNYSNDSNPTIISWTNADDYVSTTSFNGRVNLAKTFTDGTYIHSGKADTDHNYGIQGKTIRPCVTRTIAAATNWDDSESTANGWAFISSPLTSAADPTTINYANTSSSPVTIQGSMILTGDETANYDLYRFNQSVSSEWENYKAHTSDFNFVNGQGYLYANKDAKTLVFSGDKLNTSHTPAAVSLVYSTSNPDEQMWGWNLIGNPFASVATLDKASYKMNETGTAITPQVENSTVDVMEGVFVQASTNGETATFTPTSGGAKGITPVLNISVTRNRGEAIDNAIVRFDGGQTLGKFTLHEDDSKLYIPQDGHDYAIANATTESEMPLNFEASEDGTYTLTVNTEGLEMKYLHLIDNMTGADIDLTATPSYSFETKYSDFASRFRLVFRPSEDTDDDNESFAFVDANGNIIVNNMGGNATLQIIDVMGRILKSESINGYAPVNFNAATGVYMLRLINGNDVKVQKMVVR